MVRARAAALRAAGDGLGCTLVRIKLGLGVLYKDFQEITFRTFLTFSCLFFQISIQKHAIRNDVI